MEREIQPNGTLSSRLDALIDQVTAESPVDDVPPVTASAPSSPDLSGLLGGLVSNPSMLSKLPELMSTLGPLLGSLGGGLPSKGIGGVPSRSGLHLDRHTALLCAVKPYLCARRQQMADHLIGLCKMGDVLQKMPIAQGSRSEGGDDRV